MFQGISELVEKAVAALTKAVSWKAVSVRAGWSSSGLLSCHSCPHTILCLGGPAVYRQPGKRGQEINQCWKKGGGFIFGLDQFPDPLYLPDLQMVEVAQLRGQW